MVELWKAQDRGLVSYELVNLRDFGLGPRKQVDDTPYGGGDGMLLMVEPLSRPPDKTASSPPLLTIVANAVPPKSTFNTPPLTTTSPISDEPETMSWVVLIVLIWISAFACRQQRKLFSWADLNPERF